MQDFEKGTFQQFRPHQKNDDGNQEACHILNAAVSERMMGIRFLTGHLKADKGDDGGSGI